MFQPLRGPGAHRGRALPLVSAGLITVFVYAIFIGGSHPGVSLTETRMLSGLIAFVVLLGWVAVAFVDPWWRPRSVVLLPIALAFLAFCLASLFSQNPRLSQDAVLQAAGFVLAFLLLSRFAAHPFFRPRLIAIVVGITVVITFAYAIQVLVAWGVWWTSIGRFAAPPLRPAPEVVSVVSPVLGAAITRLDLGLVNLTAGLCLLALPFAIAVVAARSRALAVLVAAVGLFVLVTSASRGALLGVAFAVAAGIALTAAAFVMDADRHRGLRRRVGRSAIAGGIAVVLVSVGLMGALLPAMVGRFAVGIDQARLSLYESTIRLISAHPILGTGPGTWSILHSGATSAGARNIVQDHAHDTYLQTLSDVGIVGGLACAVIVIAVAIQLLRRFRAATGSERMVIGAILVGLAGASGHAIADHFLNLGRTASSWPPLSRSGSRMREATTPAA